ncbi:MULTISPECIES: hypothetical protein [unclassified Pseudomonas]|jgi:hypothetical protein|nr:MULTISPECIES: hypothetical protein [unclassified Pseudomonas]NMX34750.1 hypothetical protein [Pseudomonas sp. WS 5413]NMX69892.1 hypothetical protein [Pseudomonas sp. WS 5111]WLH59639.1 hypothetical protein PSH73_11545 [Pseudomonas sp. FP2294]
MTKAQFHVLLLVIVLSFFGLASGNWYVVAKMEYRIRQDFIMLVDRVDRFEDKSKLYTDLLGTRQAEVRSISEHFKTMIFAEQSLRVGALRDDVPSIARKVIAEECGKLLVCKYRPVPKQQSP